MKRSLLVAASRSVVQSSERQEMTRLELGTASPRQVPHLARRLVGGPHRRVVPAAAFLGALFLLWADALARVVLAPRELPIGVITALVGAPFLVALVRRLRGVAA